MGLTGKLSKKQIKRKADALERPLRLAMKGVPLELVDHATSDQLSVIEEVVNRITEENIKINSIATNNGLAMAFGAKKGG